MATYQHKPHTGSLLLREGLLLEDTVQELSSTHQLHDHVHLVAIIIHLGERKEEEASQWTLGMWLSHDYQVTHISELNDVWMATIAQQYLNLLIHVLH